MYINRKEWKNIWNCEKIVALMTWIRKVLRPSLKCWQAQWILIFQLSNLQCWSIIYAVAGDGYHLEWNSKSVYTSTQTQKKWMNSEASKIIREGKKNWISLGLKSHRSKRHLAHRFQHMYEGQLVGRRRPRQHPEVLEVLLHTAREKLTAFVLSGRGPHLS